MSYLLVIAGACTGTRYYDCPDSAEAGAQAGLAVFPSSIEILDRANVFCREADPLPKIPCVTWWFGTSSAHRAKIEIKADLAAPCMIHEMQHSALQIDFEDDCPSHSPACGWSEEKIEEANRLLE